ncbi:GGGtGRT protein [Faecalibacillus intestinalis]|uniref:GGGtGRT protein n=1 Tax=Faecalibacillus intestinalis TaxID=1982626 RepID=UPI00296210C8|nr:GGGtGRT protein [Faecalibacillus intestinalis]
MNFREHIEKSRFSHNKYLQGSYEVPTFFTGVIGMGNNPMVGATVAVAVAIEEACK